MRPSSSRCVRPSASDGHTLVGFTTFPDEIFRALRSWVEKLYSHVIYFHDADRGGHFAAWEEPQLFSEEIRAASGPLR